MDIIPIVGRNLGPETFIEHRFRIKVKSNLNWLEQHKPNVDHWAKLSRPLLFDFNVCHNMQDVIYVINAAD